MPKFLIERAVPGIEQMAPEELAGLAAKSNTVLAGLAPDIQWVQSYVSQDRLFCVYNAATREIIKEHARRGGFPCDTIRQVTAIIDPVTGERQA